MLNDSLTTIYDEIVRENPAQPEFHQAAMEVLESIGPAIDRHPEFTEHKIIQRICEPERQIIFRVPWQDDNGEVQINRLSDVINAAIKNDVVESHIQMAVVIDPVFYNGLLRTDHRGCIEVCQLRHL